MASCWASFPGAVFLSTILRIAARLTFLKCHSDHLPSCLKCPDSSTLWPLGTHSPSIWCSVPSASQSGPSCLPSVFDTRDTELWKGRVQNVLHLRIQHAHPLSHDCLSPLLWLSPQLFISSPLTESVHMLSGSLRVWGLSKERVVTERWQWHSHVLF